MSYLLFDNVLFTDGILSNVLLRFIFGISYQNVKAYVLIRFHHFLEGFFIISLLIPHLIELSIILFLDNFINSI